MVKKLGNADYMGLPKEDRDKALAAYKGLTSDGSMPAPGHVALGYTQFAQLHKLVLDSLAVEYRERAADLTRAIACVITARPVRFGGMVGLMRVNPHRVIFDPLQGTIYMEGEQGDGDFGDPSDED